MKGLGPDEAMTITVRHVVLGTELRRQIKPGAQRRVSVRFPFLGAEPHVTPAVAIGVSSERLQIDYAKTFHVPEDSETAFALRKLLRPNVGNGQVMFALMVEGEATSPTSVGECEEFGHAVLTLEDVLERGDDVDLNLPIIGPTDEPYESSYLAVSVVASALLKREGL